MQRKSRYFYRHHTTHGRSCAGWLQEFVAVVVYELRVRNDAISSIVIVTGNGYEGGAQQSDGFAERRFVLFVVNVAYYRVRAIVFGVGYLRFYGC